MNVSSKAAAATALPPQPRRYEGANWEGMKTLYLREVRRFWKVGMQTVAAPVVTTLLYMMIFVVAMQDARQPLGGVTFGQFVAPGLVMMAILNNAFANSSSSLIQSKLMGTASDFLTPPLTPVELLAGFGLGAATRGVVVGVVTAACVWPFAGFSFDGFTLAQAGAIVFYAVFASLLMGLIGIIAGLWSEKFDHLAAVQNFVVMPMTFLSGTFYLVDRLPEPFRSLSHFNPFFYLIDGFRFGFIGDAEGSLAVGMTLTVGLTALLAFVCWRLFRSGWRLKT